MNTGEEQMDMEEMDMEERQEFEMLSKRDREERQDTGAGNSLQRGMAIDIRRLII